MNRRDFLKGLAYTTSAVALGIGIAPKSEMWRPIDNLMPSSTPLEDLSTLGWKSWHSSKILHPDWIKAIEVS